MPQLTENKQNGPVLIANFEPTACARKSAQKVEGRRLCAGESAQKERIQTRIVGRQEPCMRRALPFHASAIAGSDLASKTRKKVSLDSLGGTANFAAGSDLGRKGQWPISSSGRYRLGSLMGFSFTVHCNAECHRDSQKVEVQGRRRRHCALRSPRRPLRMNPRGFTGVLEVIETKKNGKSACPSRFFDKELAAGFEF